MTAVAVVGLGKIGLPIAAQFATAGAQVIGCDVDEFVVGAINEGLCPIVGEPGLPDAVRAARASGKLAATTDTARAVDASEVTICIVPVGIDPARHPDFKNLDAAAAAISAGLHRGSLVILETTVPVGITRTRFGRDLERGSGLRLGDFDLAYSPERVSSGQILRDLATYPKIVGGVNEGAGDRAAAFYRKMLPADVNLLPDAETAEFAKLAESVYRDVNIALANDLARAADALGIDYTTAARAANSQPFSHLHTPGVGVGGHCIPVYPYFLTNAIPDQRLIALGREVNDSMAAYAADRLDEALRAHRPTGVQGATVLVLGLGYRGNVKEAAFSSALLLVDALRARGAHTIVHDPLFSDEEIESMGLLPSPLPPRAPIDAAILQAAHAEYETLDLARLKGCRIFLDGRGAVDRARVEAAGMGYLAIGSAGRV